jgi:peptidoglycan hydrolase-like protein with peptidoglycan-binding domain
VTDPGAGLVRYRRRRRARLGAGATAVLLLLGALAVAARGFGGTQGQPPASSTLPPATAKVTRATLVQTVQVAGTLGYGKPGTVVARPSAAASNGGAASSNGGAASSNGGAASSNGGAASSNGGAASSNDGAASSNDGAAKATTTNSGTTGTGTAGTETLTWLPPIGAVVRPGQAMYTVDERPVVLIAGTLPLYRVLTVGVAGADVREVERALRSFGYTGFTVDTRYTSSTAAAVKRWQKKVGLNQTGTIDINQMVVAPGALRVTEHKAELGAHADGPVLGYTGTTRTVTVPVPVTQQQLVRVGLSATVTLPDGRAVGGKVASVGTVAVAPQDGGDGPAASGPATVEVIVTIADQTALGVLDQAPVQLNLVAAERKDVLTVPVAALLALIEGGYGVQVVDGTTTRYVAVKTGMFGDGLVEVTGDGITEGLTVGVPA